MAPKASTSKLEGGEKKASQRPSWSCTQCTRKKIKCSKIIPCQQCIGRGKGKECHLAEQDADMPPRDPLENPHRETRMATEAEFDSLRSSVVGIRQRLFHLESALSSFVPQFAQDGAKMYAYQSEEAKVETGTAVGGSVGGYHSQSEEPEMEHLLDADGDVEAAVTLEFLALGRDRKTEHFARGAVRRPDDEESFVPANPHNGLSSSSNIDPSLQSSSLFPIDSSPYSPNATSPTDSLPEKDLSDKIIRFSLEFALWQHSAVHPDVFLAEVAEFHSWKENRGNLVNQAWLALYYSLLCTGVRNMKPSDATAIGISAEDLKSLPKRYYDCSIASLYRSNFMSKHTVFTVQAIVVLNHSCLDIGGSDFSATLLSCGIRIAQHLSLHRFSSDEEWEKRRRRNGVDPSSPAGINGLIVREIRKRLWAALSTDDWFGAAYRRPYAIIPAHCTTPPPINCHDEDLARGLLVARPMDEPTVVSKLILTMRVASCIRRFFEDINQAGSMNATLCRMVDTEIRAILATGPSWLQPEINIDHLPPFVSWFRRYFLISTNHKLLVIHRTFVGRSIKGVEYAFSRKAMSEAARNILSQFIDAPLSYQHVWTLPYHALVASTTLILEMFQDVAGDTVQEKRTLVESAQARLQTMEDYSPIAVRGVQLIVTLLAEESARRAGASSSSGTATANGRKRSASHANLPDLETLPKRMSHSNSNSPALGGSSALAFSPTASMGTPPAFPSIMAEVDHSMGVLGGSSLLQDSQDALDWLLANPMESSWQAGDGEGEDPSLFANDPSLDFWRLLDGHDTGSGVDMI
ncbi:hypothetical protein RQP46_004379 [Phenoliferia psychrophenolica]